MVRMRASCSSTCWALTSSRLAWLDSGGEPGAFAGGALVITVGSGGKGIAGGGEGRDATEALLGRFEVIELERSLNCCPSL